jgi:hypothetical protein
MLNIGIIGANEGNGHPYSYSALFNGFSHDLLMRKCPYDLIKSYLPAHHKGKIHIWTQDINISNDIAEICYIPNVLHDLSEMVNCVDAVILARDDPENHLVLAKPFLDNKIPIFIDKLLTDSQAELEIFDDYINNGCLIMSCSPIRYSIEINEFLELKNSQFHSIQGMSKVSWLRYGHHLFEGIFMKFGSDINSIRSLSAKIDHDILFLEYKNGLTCFLEFKTGTSLPISFKLFSENNPVEVKFDNYFYSFKSMLNEFIEMVKQKKLMISWEEQVELTKIIIAGNISKMNNGLKVNPKTLKIIGN